MHMFPIRIPIANINKPALINQMLSFQNLTIYLLHSFFREIIIVNRILI